MPDHAAPALADANSAGDLDPTAFATAGHDDVVHLTRGGTSLLVRLPATELPSVLHWGPSLGDDAVDPAQVLTALSMPDSDSVITRQEAVALLPRHGAGWLGRPGLLGHRRGASWSVCFDEVVHRLQERPSPVTGVTDGRTGVVGLRSIGHDRAAELEVTTELELHPSGVVRVRASVRNLADAPFDVLAVDPALPVPAEAGELLDLAGRHTHERQPQRRPFDIGAWVREAWGGRPGHDAATVLCAGTPGFAFRTGHVWGVHVAWSGNHVTAAERSVSDWRLLRGTELLLPGEVRLGTGETYTSPWLVGSWGEGLDDLSARLHTFVRTRPTHPRTPRPVLLNTWEAVYFDHDLDRLTALADRAASIGVERFVLDDGWFHGRRDDTAGLGDWVVDAAVWPSGLRPLVDHVHALGMQFGLWVEPEMVNLDSDLARAHPDWLFATQHGPGIASRQQHVLDLAHPGAYRHVLEQVSALVHQYSISYLKWDHNRPLVDAGHGPTGRPGVRAHTLAVYRLLDELRQRHPDLEIESCAGGGARIDLAIVDRTDRFWVSDCIDAHERHRLVRWTGLLMPPELLGTHVGSGHDHSTGRSLDLTFRAGTAIWGHFGIETDLTRLTDADLDCLRGWVDLHKAWRPLLHSGRVVHADTTNPVLSLDGVVAEDRSRAVYRLSALDHTLVWPHGRIQLPGLDPYRSYRVTLEALPATGPSHEPPTYPAADDGLPAWARTGTSLPGRLLATVGVQSPLLDVDDLVLISAVQC